MEGRVRRTLSFRREKRPHDEHRPAPAHHRACLPCSRYPRVSRLRQKIRWRVVDRPRRDRRLVPEEPQKPYRLGLLRAALTLSALHHLRHPRRLIERARELLEQIEKRLALL